MNRLLSIIFIAMFFILNGCVQHQYNGSHIAESKQKTLTDEHNNYHVRETKKVLDKNEKRNDKKEKEDLQKKKGISKLNSSLKDLKNQKKKSLKFDFYW